jgi:hypothetical protein
VNKKDSASTLPVFIALILRRITRHTDKCSRARGAYRPAVGVISIRCGPFAGVPEMRNGKRRNQYNIFGVSAADGWIGEDLACVARIILDPGQHG